MEGTCGHSRGLGRPSLIISQEVPLGSSVAGLGQKAQILRTLGEKNVCSRKRLLARRSTLNIRYHMETLILTF